MKELEKTETEREIERERERRRGGAAVREGGKVDGGMGGEPGGRRR